MEVERDRFLGACHRGDQWIHMEFHLNIVHFAHPWVVCNKITQISKIDGFEYFESPGGNIYFNFIAL